MSWKATIFKKLVKLLVCKKNLNFLPCDPPLSWVPPRRRKRDTIHHDNRQDTEGLPRRGKSVPLSALCQECQAGPPPNLQFLHLQSQVDDEDLPSSSLRWIFFIFIFICIFWRWIFIIRSSFIDASSSSLKDSSNFMFKRSTFESYFELVSEFRNPK